SLLGVKTAGEKGFPVGKVNFLHLYPLTFFEFLSALGQEKLRLFLEEYHSYEPIANPLHEKLLQLLKFYFFIGGMPEAIAKWVETKNPMDSFLVHQSLADTYKQDFEKYAKKHQLKYLNVLFDQIPYFIGNQFKYSEIHGEYKKRELAPCLELLCHANIIHKILHTAGNGLPLGAEINLEWFKIIFLDTALCQAVIGSDLSPWFLDPKATFINQGSVVEAFIGQELLCYSMPQRKMNLYFWKREQRTSNAEVDYLYDYKGQIIPIEVKSGEGSTLKSMHLFLEEHKKSPYGVRFSTHNYSSIGNVDSRPHYAVASLAHEEQREALQSLIES
ncbi:MAG: DUF4143 domain-containing protein, partial [Chlamydiota bacterium]